MNCIKPIFENRKFIRFPIIQDAIVALRSDSDVLGRVIDISLGGLSFGYIESDVRPDTAGYLILFTVNHQFCLDQVRFKTVSDFSLKNQLSFSSIRMRRCGLEFEDLTGRQRRQIEAFIVNYTAAAPNTGSLSYHRAAPAAVYPSF